MLKTRKAYCSFILIEPLLVVLVSVPGGSVHVSAIGHYDYVGWYRVITTLRAGKLCYMNIYLNTYLANCFRLFIALLGACFIKTVALTIMFELVWSNSKWNSQCTACRFAIFSFRYFKSFWTIQTTQYFVFLLFVVKIFVKFIS